MNKVYLELKVLSDEYVFARWVKLLKVGNYSRK